MTPQEVWDYYKSSYRFAKETGMSNSSLINWTKWGFVPEDSQYKLERLTHGELKHESVNKKKNLPDDVIAFMELKGKIVKLMFWFTNKYKHLYPETGHILINVLDSCLNEAKLQMNAKEIK